MKFRDFAEDLLGSRIKMKILRLLVSEETITSERELAKMMGISHGAVNKAMKDFHDINLVTPLRIGNTMAWQINKESFAYAYVHSLAAIFSPLEHLKALIKDSLQHLGPVKKVVIYGSIANGRELPGSDVDVFVLVKKEEDKKNVLANISDLGNICIKKFGNKISPNLFTEKDIKSKRNKKLMENIEKGVVVFERED